MGITQIVGLGIVTAALAVVIRQQSPEFGMLIGICGSVLIFLTILPQLTVVIEVFNELQSKVPADAGYINIILKIVGVAYIAEFGAQICADAGENAIASKIELSGKVLVMLMSAPIVLGLMRLITGALP